jgi:hypothetical protein
LPSIQLSIDVILQPGLLITHRVEPADGSQRKLGPCRVGLACFERQAAGTREGGATVQRAGDLLVAGSHDQQQGVEAVADACFLVHQLIAGVHQQLQVGIEVSLIHRRQVGLAHRDASDGDSVAFFVLAASPGALALIGGQI